MSLTCTNVFFTPTAFFLWHRPTGFLHATTSQHPQFKRAFKRNDKPVCLAACTFIAHLVNQQVVHELLALEIIILLLEQPSDDSVEVAVGFTKEVGATLTDLAPQAVNTLFDRFRAVLTDGDIDTRTKYLIEGLFAVRKQRFPNNPAMPSELDLVETEDQITHEV